MWYLRKAVNKTRRDHVRNEEITRTVETPPAVKYRKVEHIMRMSPMSPAARANNMKLVTEGGRGRPIRRWIKGVTDNLGLQNTTAYQATEKHLSRKPITGGVHNSLRQNSEMEKRKKESKKERQPGRQTDRQIARKTDRQTERI